MYFQDKAGTIINTFKDNLTLEQALDNLLKEFERSFSVNNQ